MSNKLLLHGYCSLHFRNTHKWLLTVWEFWDSHHIPPIDMWKDLTDTAERHYPRKVTVSTHLPVLSLSCWPPTWLLSSFLLCGSLRWLNVRCGMTLCFWRKAFACALMLRTTTLFVGWRRPTVKQLICKCPCCGWRPETLRSKTNHKPWLQVEHLDSTADTYTLMVNPLHRQKHDNGGVCLLAFLQFFQNIFPFFSYCFYLKSFFIIRICVFIF